MMIRGSGFTGKVARAGNELSYATVRVFEGQEPDVEDILRRIRQFLERLGNRFIENLLTLLHGVTYLPEKCLTASC